MTQTISSTTTGEGEGEVGTNDALADAVLELLHKYNGIKARMVSGPEADQSPVFLLAKLVLGGPKRSGSWLRRCAPTRRRCPGRLQRWSRPAWCSARPIRRTAGHACWYRPRPACSASNSTSSAAEPR